MSRYKSFVVDNEKNVCYLELDLFFGEKKYGN